MSKKKPKDAGYNFTLKSLYSEDKMLFVMLILILIMFLTSLPIGTLMTGKYLRDSVPTRSLDEIMYQNNQQLIGKIVAEKNGTFYISNQDWQLVMIKSDEVSTTPQK